MIDATGRPQRVLLLGGTSEIGLAIVVRLFDGRSGEVVLAGRDPDGLADAAAALTRAGHAVTTLAFEAADVATHAAMLDEAFASYVDVAIVAFGQLHDQAKLLADPLAAAHLAEVNYVGALSVGLHLASRFRAQGYGHMLALSSVAAERPRRSNYVYGSSKAGFDALFTGLADDLHGSGVTVTVLRPGFVQTRMTRGLKPAPLATTADAVADVAAEAVRTRRPLAHVPGALRWVMLILRLMPRRLFRRLPL